MIEVTMKFFIEVLPGEVPSDVVAFYSKNLPLVMEMATVTKDMIVMFKELP